jgi:hypothetical protein
MCISAELTGEGIVSADPDGLIARHVSPSMSPCHHIAQEARQTVEGSNIMYDLIERVSIQSHQAPMLQMCYQNVRSSVIVAAVYPDPWCSDIL